LPSRGRPTRTTATGSWCPLISLYFANLAAERGPVRVRGGAALGVTLLAARPLAKADHLPSGSRTLGDIALVASLAGLCALLVGVEAVRRSWFANRLSCSS